jgi:hypothetical protein
MAIVQTKYLFTARMDVEPEKEDLFNEVYDEEHIPILSEVPGVLAIARFKTQELTMVIGGERRQMTIENEPKYSALYELESPEVLTSDAWANAVDRGRWADEVRPYTRNRRHLLLKRTSPSS